MRPSSLSDPIYRARPLTLRVAALAAALLAAACGGDEGPTDPGGGADCVGGVPTLSISFANSNLTPTGGGALRCRYTAEVAVHGDHAYTSTWGMRENNAGNVIHIWDVRAAAPTRVGSVLVEGASTTGDVQVSDDGRLLVVATEYAPGSIAIYDLADPRRPALLSRFTSANTRPGVHTAAVARVNGRQYAFLSVDPASGFPARLVIVDLSNPRAPVEVLSQAMGSPFVHDVFVRGGLLFTALWDSGLWIWDIGGGGQGGTPSSPVHLGATAIVGGNAHNVWWFHDPASGARRYAFVGEEQPGVIGASSGGDIHVVDVSDLTAPREVAVFSVPGAGTHNFWMDESRGDLYAAYYNGGVRAIDVRGDLSACGPAHRLPDGRCDLAAMGRELGRGLVGGNPVFVWGVDGTGGSLYASDMLNGLWKFALVTP